MFLTTLERPLILTNVRGHATALLGDFGIADEPLLALITGKASPGGRVSLRATVLGGGSEATEK